MKLFNLRIFIPFLIFTTFFVFFSCISLYRYFSLQLFHYDFGIFASIIWQLSQGNLATIDHISLGKIVFLGDHFQPSLVLLSPLFWIIQDIKILIFEQAFALAASGAIIYLIALKRKLSWSVALILSVVFLLYAGIEFPLVSDWHPEPTAGLTLLLFIYFFLYTKRKFLTIMFAIIFLGFKESNAISLSFFLISCFFTLPKRNKEILIYLSCSIIWFILSIKLFIPYLANREYFYTPVLPKNLTEIIESLSKSIKYEFIWKSLLSFGFLPLFARYGMIPVLGEIAIRILPLHSFFENYSLGMHYNVYLGIFLALATIEGFVYLTGKIKSPKFTIILAFFLLTVSVIVAKKVTISPIVIVTNKVFWQELRPRQANQENLDRVPKTGLIASQNNLLPYMLLRNEEVILINIGYRSKKPQIIVFDLTEGQNPNNFFPKDFTFYQNEKNYLEKSTEYKRLPTENKNFYIFVKN